MTKKIVIGLLMVLLSLGSGLALAAEPALHDVYQAASSGRLDEAQRMMHEVLAAHPNSGKAHYVEAELLAKQGLSTQAAGELATAERLAPGLPFAKPQAVSELRQLVQRSAASVPARSVVPSVARPAAPDIPWALLLTGIGLIAFIAWAARFMSQRNAAPVYAGGSLPATTAGSGMMGAPGMNYGGPAQPSPAWGAAGVQPALPGQGLGARVMGGLATGAAVGAGVVAGEAMMRHFMGGGSGNEALTRPSGGFDAPATTRDNGFDDMGGSDFGINDSTSWDDNASGDSDWN